MAHAKLIDFTGRGSADPELYAANLLLFTKSTRLTMDPDGLESFSAMPLEEKLARIDEMAETIPSSWEFVDVVFLFSGVSRACAQQITRTRTGSYAMQSLRVVDGAALGMVNPFDGQGDARATTFTQYADLARLGYKRLVDLGSSAQDARGLLPLATECNLVAKYNLRAFVDLVRSRESLRTQGEYADLIAQAKAAVLDIWPWAAAFFRSPFDAALAMLTEVAEELGITPGAGHGWRIAKAIDLLRKA